jgi:ATP-dependent protease ClpP protease subunit
MKENKDNVSIEDVFNKHVPIVTTEIGPDAYKHVVHIVRDIEEPHLYVELIALLEACKPQDNVILNLATPGGYLSTALLIRDALKFTEASTVAYIAAEVASAGTMIALSCDNLEVADDASMMIHYYSQGVYGKGNELKARADFEARSMPKLFKKVYKTFLTKKETKDIIADKDLYLNKKEILRRWKLVQEKAEEKQAKAQEEAQVDQDVLMVEHLRTRGYDVTPTKVLEGS